MAAYPVAARFLERALLFALVIHALAMLAMVALLLPGMPGGPTSGVAARMAYVAAHPWLWRIGWLPWQLTALGDVLVGLALVRTPWIPRPPAVLALLVTIAGVVPDQAGEGLWITTGVSLAQQGDPVRYAAFEARVFSWTAVWGATGYTLAAVGWSWCFAAAGTWRRWLTPYSIVLWGLFAAISAAPLLAQLDARLRLPADVVSVGNAVGFVLLLVWLACVGELVLRRARPDVPYGRAAPWRTPARGPLAWGCDLVANSRLLRALSEYLPVVGFESDITDVIYVNYLVDAARLEPLVPPGLELQRLGPSGEFALFTFLTYNHGHFGPRLLGPLRRLLPSPVQTNWRIYVRDPRTGHEGVFFVTNAIDWTPHALAARLLSEGMPMHRLARAEVWRTRAGALVLRLDPGAGSAPDAEAILQQLSSWPTTGPWSAAFPDYRAMLAYCVPQDRALSTQPWYRRITRQEIELGIPLDVCEAMTGDVDSAAARRIVGAAQPFSFRVPAVRFRFLREEYAP
jgi:hypothetical protein